MNKLRNIIKLFPETWGLPVALLLWFVVPFILRMIDPTAASFDAGVLHKIVYAMIAVLAFNALAFLGSRLNFKDVARTYEEYFENHYNSLESWQKVRVIITLVFGYLFAFCLCLFSL